MAAGPVTVDIKASDRSVDTIYADGFREDHGPCKKIPDKEIRNCGLACFQWVKIAWFTVERLMAPITAGTTCMSQKMSYL